VSIILLIKACQKYGINKVLFVEKTGLMPKTKMHGGLRKCIIVFKKRGQNDAFNNPKT
jgi:hypothetical protein